MKLIDAIYNFFVRKTSQDPVETSTATAEECYIDYALRRLAFDTCVNLIANAIGNCEFQTLLRGEQNRGAEYYTLNVEPNAVQNSSAFWHELVYKLHLANEALVVSRHNADGREELIIADDFSSSNSWPSKPNTYTNVTVNGSVLNKSYAEDDVLHIVLHNKNIGSLVNMLYASYGQLINAAEAAYSWREGQHVKVHVEQTASGKDGWQNDFYKKINEQLKPWLRNRSGVLPEFDGYKYEIFGEKSSGGTTRDIRALYDDIFDFTARAFGIPPVLVKGDVADSKDAFSRWLTTCIDPLAVQIEEELNRKRYGLKAWKKGSYVHIDTSTLIHFDMFQNAASIEKLVGSGAYSINDILIAAGKARVDEEWADAHYLTKNIASMDETAQDISANGEEEGNA